MFFFLFFSFPLRHMATFGAANLIRLTTSGSRHSLAAVLYYKPDLRTRTCNAKANGYVQTVTGLRPLTLAHPPDLSITKLEIVQRIRNLKTDSLQLSVQFQISRDLSSGDSLISQPYEWLSGTLQVVARIHCSSCPGALCQNHGRQIRTLNRTYNRHEDQAPTYLGSGRRSLTC